MNPITPLLMATALLAAPAWAHDAADGKPHSHDVTDATPLPFVVEKKGPVSVPRLDKAAGLQVSGQGYWKFVAARDLTPVPAEAMPRLKGAHGTIIVDKAADVVYWGLAKVGWIGFSNKLTKSWIVQGDATFTNGNLHGGDLLPRRGKTPLIAAADNVSGKTYLTDTTFQHADVLPMPEGDPYADKKGFAPTDVAFVDGRELWVTDGYGKAWFMPADVSPLKYQGKFFGGKPFSGTPHGISYDAVGKALIVSARPEGQIKRFGLKQKNVQDIAGLPAGSTVCDVDIWGDYALAPCLDGPNKSSGPIYIINLKKRAVVSTIKVKDELGYADALHIHDAAWYVTGRGRPQEVYIVFTNWNPGGVGAIKLVNIPD
jgi:hypothetical protein